MSHVVVIDVVPLIFWLKGALVSHIWVCQNHGPLSLSDFDGPLFHSGSESTWSEAFWLFVLRLPPVFNAEDRLPRIEVERGDEWC